MFRSEITFIAPNPKHCLHEGDALVLIRGCACAFSMFSADLSEQDARRVGMQTPQPLTRLLLPILSIQTVLSLPPPTFIAMTERKTRGAFIVIEGLDRSGKSTQVSLLEKRLKAEGVAVRLVKFPGELLKLPSAV